jgi:hypothetical protein
MANQILEHRLAVGHELDLRVVVVDLAVECGRDLLAGDLDVEVGLKSGRVCNRGLVRGMSSVHQGVGLDRRWSSPSHGFFGD